MRIAGSAVTVRERVAAVSADPRPGCPAVRVALVVARLARLMPVVRQIAVLEGEQQEERSEAHADMPAILHPRDYDEWLSREEVEGPPVHLLRPFEASEMRVHSAHPKVGNVRNQGPEMLNSA